MTAPLRSSLCRADRRSARLRSEARAAAVELYAARVECDSRARRWWAEGARVPDGAAFPTAPARAALALAMPADWRT